MGTGHQVDQLAAHVDRAHAIGCGRCSTEGVVHGCTTLRAAASELLTRGWTADPSRVLCPDCANECGTGPEPKNGAGATVHREPVEYCLRPVRGNLCGQPKGHTDPCAPQLVRRPLPGGGVSVTAKAVPGFRLSSSSTPAH